MLQNVITSGMLMPAGQRRRLRKGFDGLFTSETTATTWTQAVQLRDAPSATRLVVAVLCTSGASQTHTSCTVLGTALTARINVGAAATNYMTIFADYIAAGNAGNAVSVASASTGRWALALWSFTRASATPDNTYSDITQPETAALALTSGCIAIAATRGVNVDVSRPNWKGLTPIARARVGTNLNFSVAAIHRARIAETRNIETDWDYGSSPEQLLAAVWA